MNKSEFTVRSEQIKKKLFHTACLYVGDEDLALEIVGEAVYKGFASLRKLRQPEYFETWLTRILINECKKELRRRKRIQPLGIVPEVAANAEDTKEMEELLDSLPLKEALLHLPQELKEVIIIRYFTGFTLSETARSLEIPQGTVVTRQRRALQLLKLELSEEEE